MSLFGRIIDGDYVEQAALATLVKWMPTYIMEAARQRGIDPDLIAQVRSYTTQNEFDKWPEDQLPCILLISTGLRDTPDRDGEGKYRARWMLGVAALASARTQADTNKLAKLYSAAARAVLVQRPSLDGYAAGVEWLDERYDVLRQEDTRTLGAGQNVFSVEVRNVLDAFGGPVDPSTGSDPVLDPSEDPGDWPSVEIDGAIIEVRKEPIT